MDNTIEDVEKEMGEIVSELEYGLTEYRNEHSSWVAEEKLEALKEMKESVATFRKLEEKLLEIRLKKQKPASRAELEYVRKTIEHKNIVDKDEYEINKWNVSFLLDEIEKKVKDGPAGEG
jgi:hypothetical protein